MGKDGRINWQDAIEQAVYDLYAKYSMQEWLSAQERLVEKCMAELEFYEVFKETLKSKEDFEHFVIQVLLDTV